MNEYTIFKGESKGFRLTVTTGGEDVEDLAVAIVQNHARRVFTYQLEDGTLAKDGDTYVFELTAQQSDTLRPGGYAIEGYLTTASGTTIKPLGEIKVLTNKMYTI